MAEEKVNCIFRLAEDKDLPEIEQIWRDGIKQLYPSITIDQTILDGFRNNFSKRYNYFNFWVADSSTIIGWCSILPAFSHPLKDKLNAEVSTYVDKAINNVGVGTKLMQHVFKELALSQIQCVFGFAFPANVKSIKMCEHAGMKICGQTSDKVILIKEFK